MKAQVVEVFSSFQGEGVMVGTRQSFLRLAGCNLNCRYCDTDFSEKDKALVEIEAGSRKWQKVKNPLSAQALEKIAERLSMNKKKRWLVITGGEPLLQAEFLSSFLPGLKSKGWQVFLETNGTLPEKLGLVLDLIDHVAMDFKLESASGESKLKESLTFLNQIQKVEYEVKAVVTMETSLEEFQEVVVKVSRVNRTAPFIIQPVNQSFLAPNQRQLFQLETLARNHLSNVRVIPQVHKFMGWW
jgi:organic radical activating enzyme